MSEAGSTLGPAIGERVAGSRPDAVRPLPLWPRCWYVVARAADLRPGQILHGELAGRAYVLFRGQDGVLAALDAFCPHMGTHLRHGQVVGDHVRCPLHHWTIARDGGCRGVGAGERHRGHPWPVAERFGLVFLHPPEGEPPALPLPETPDDYAWLTGRPVLLDTDWRAMMVHGFDLLHLRAVHHRAVVEVRELGEREGAVRLSYVSRVEGATSPSDYLMRWLSGNQIRVRQSCYGATMVVESEVGRQRTSAVLGLTVKEGQVQAFGAFGARRSTPLVGLRLLFTRWLFTAFLRRDFAVVEGIRFNLDGAEDPGVQALAGYLRGLPAIDGGARHG